MAANRHKNRHSRRRATRARSDRINGLSREQRHFILEKLLAQSDLEAALAAGYSMSTARNTKQKIWARPGVRAEFERLKGIIFEAFSSAAREQLAAASISAISAAPEPPNPQPAGG